MKSLFTNHLLLSQIGIHKVFASTHYSGINLTMRFGPNEPWKKVYGPVFVYVNSMSDGEDPRSLWMDAKEQVFMNTFDALTYQTSSNLPVHIV